jgi:4-hydroxy-3-polyprenylbenzoate decarboxylase
MAFSSLSDFISALEKNGELIRISRFVNPELEISEISDRFSKLPGGGKALLFENTGTEFPVLINSLGSERRMCIALGIQNLDDVSADIDTILSLLAEPRQTWIKKLSILPSLAKFAGFMPEKGVKRPVCQEVINLSPDLEALPVLKTWPFDGGRFITFPLVHTIDPETGNRNVGMYRMQIFDKNTTGMHWHRHKTGASHFAKYKKAGKLMPVAVALGGDPVLTYCATAPLPDQLDEYIFAGFLRKKSVRLARAITQDIDVPADADIIIEGYVDPSEDFRAEGPFGDHTGFYSLTDDYPVFHVTCITHRRVAVFPATVVGIPPMEDAWIAKATERIFLWPIKKTIVPEMTEMNIPEFGVAHNLTITSIDKTFPGQAEKVMNALWGAGQMMFNKFLVVTDDKNNIGNYAEMLRRFSMLDFSSHLVFIKGPLDVLDHSAHSMGFGSKMGIDLTSGLPEEQQIYSIHTAQADEITVKSKSLIVKSEYIANRHPGILILILSIKKGSRDDIANEIKTILPDFPGTGPRIVVLLDENVDPADYYLVSWVTLNNIDPLRDISILSLKNDQILILNATSKEFGNDSFKRPWPNVIVMDDKTIKDIDDKWAEIVPFGFIESPSLRFKKMVLNSGAVANPGYFISH